MMALLSTLNYVPAFMASLLLLAILVKYVVIPAASFVSFVQNKTNPAALLPMTLFVFMPALAAFGAATTFAFSMFLYMIGVVH